MRSRCDLCRQRCSPFRLDAPGTSALIVKTILPVAYCRRCALLHSRHRISTTPLPLRALLRRYFCRLVPSSPRLVGGWRPFRRQTRPLASSSPHPRHSWSNLPPAAAPPPLPHSAPCRPHPRLHLVCYHPLPCCPNRSGYRRRRRRQKRRSQQTPNACPPLPLPRPQGSPKLFLSRFRRRRQSAKSHHN